MKRRTGAHERSIRELGLTNRGLQIGEPLHGFQGVLTGVPVLLERPPAKEPGARA
jgi:circadian clock protein KaiC